MSIDLLCEREASSPMGSGRLSDPGARRLLGIRAFTMTCMSPVKHMKIIGTSSWQMLVL